MQPRRRRGNLAARGASREGGVMKENIKALLVRARHDPLDALRMALEEQSIEIFTAKNCARSGSGAMVGLPTSFGVYGSSACRWQMGGCSYPGREGVRSQ